jgi:uncharacterized membrane-anchored protein YitT (DUF2179 family)
MIFCFRGENMKEKIKSLACIVLGNTLIAFAVSTLILENNIIVGGVTGLGRVINYFTGISLTIVVYIISIVLFLSALFFIGKKFALSALVSTFLFPILLDFFENQNILHYYCKDILLACIIAGCLIGIGAGLILKANASSGGIDIIGIIVNKKFNTPVHITLNVIDLFILTFQITFSSSTNVLYGLVVVFLTYFMLNKTLSFGKDMMQVVIMSDYYDEIKKAIILEADTGVTLLHIEKGFSKVKAKAISTVIPSEKLQKVKNIVNKIDYSAFITVSTIREVGGRGYTINRSYNVPDLSNMTSI